MEHPNKEIERIQNDLVPLESNNEKILYLERWIRSSKQREVIGPAVDDEAFKWVKYELKYLYKEAELEKKSKLPQGNKINWKGSPALFGYIFMEFVKNGFIDPPLRSGEMNYAGFAKLCFTHFNVNNTPLENLIKEINPKKNTLSDTKRAKFPNLSDLA